MSFFQTPDLSDFGRFAIADGFYEESETRKIVSMEFELLGGS